MKVFDPYSYEAIIDSIRLKFRSQAMHRLGNLQKFHGSGIYAIYYVGKDTSIYRPSREVPIYVGKADFVGSRRGILNKEVIEESTKLYTRLQDHARSIASAENLNLNDFRCKFLRVSPQHIYTAEVSLIATYAPVWNTILSGFGQKSCVMGSTRTPWDTLHPGRPQGDGTVPNSIEADEFSAMIRAHQKKRAGLSAREIAEVLSVA